jgi:hypothetical protein
MAAPLLSLIEARIRRRSTALTDEVSRFALRRISAHDRLLGDLFAVLSQLDDCVTDIPMVLPASIGVIVLGSLVVAVLKMTVKVVHQVRFES